MQTHLIRGSRGDEALIEFTATNTMNAPGIEKDELESPDVVSYDILGPLSALENDRLVQLAALRAT